MYHLLDSVAIRKIVSVTLFVTYSTSEEWSYGIDDNLIKSVDLEKIECTSHNIMIMKKRHQTKRYDDSNPFNQAKNVESLSSE